LEADVMDSAPVLAPLRAGDGIVLEVEDGEVDVPVAQIVSAGGGGIDPADLLHAEHVGVEAGGGIWVLGGDGDVLDLGHWCGVLRAARVRQNMALLNAFDNLSPIWDYL